MFQREEQFFSHGVVTHVVKAQVASIDDPHRFCAGHGYALQFVLHCTYKKHFTMEL